MSHLEAPDDLYIGNKKVLIFELIFLLKKTRELVTNYFEARRANS